MQICGFCKKEVDPTDFIKGRRFNKDTVGEIKTNVLIYSCPHCHAILGISKI